MASAAADAETGEAKRSGCALLSILSAARQAGPNACVYVAAAAAPTGLGTHTLNCLSVLEPVVLRDSAYSFYGAFGPC